MTEIVHLRCDRCDVDTVIDSRRLMSDTERAWVRCSIGLDRLDFCPACWKEIYGAGATPDSHL